MTSVKKSPAEVLVDAFVEPVERRDEDVSVLIEGLTDLVTEQGYSVVDVDTDRPWGGFIRLDTVDGDRFVEEFFPGISADEARLGDSSLELSPKFLVVKPHQRLSWQRHERRAERWVFLTPGFYHRSNAPEDQGEQQFAPAGTSVQFEAGECHRLVGGERCTLVAEIWQHTNQESPSDESDIERLEDDYSRA